MLAAALLAYSLGAHFQYWGPPPHEFVGKDHKKHMSPGVIQKGVSIGTPRVDEHLILFFPDGTCGRMRVFSGHYGDLDKARAFLWKSGLCRKH